MDKEKEEQLLKHQYEKGEISLRLLVYELNRLYKSYEEIEQLKEDLKSMTKQMESWRTECRFEYDVNTEWAKEHLELLEYLLGVKCNTTDEALHCLYQRYISSVYMPNKGGQKWIQ